ncbi:DUF4241 domain-containing protein [Glycomyces sp. TRM65418]|uniref:DUF4241 domain-containing protein n=1 Tax=Glycomyces sp. TRM65418 TaxID=2867006 RepID=UPI001CE6A3A5|nr:DUF4241 domain-containing protein [Glycomyces sp. TRM65418]MCC3763329.1 DUF4241 domain-containing protein [Glycomyces sp. TRM65418]QZD57326.1 DUF4241 domain-containing protein [Glycomyces sp. TRM65418]
MAYTPDFKQLLQAGATFTTGWGGEGVIEPVELDKTVLPTGRVVGCDPLVDPESLPYLVTVEPGAYPLIAWVAVLSKDGKETDRRVAALELRIGDAPAVAWEMAVANPDLNVEELDSDGYFGYPVDAGCGTLADEAALRPLGEWDYDRTEEVLIDEADWEGPVPGLASAVTDPTTGANVVLVGSGWGDGSYPTFIGRDADGAVVRFVTDFLVPPA